MKRLAMLFMTVAVLILPGCSDESDQPYLEFIGGGFIFNYRIGEAFYGFVARPVRDIPVDTRIMAEFEDPAGGPPLLVAQEAKPNQIQYSFRTPGVKKVVKGRPYEVVVKLISMESGDIFAEYRTSFKSSIDQSDLPDSPLTIGPGYDRHPASRSRP